MMQLSSRFIPKKRNLTKRLLCPVFLFLAWGNYHTQGADLLEKAFLQSKQNQQIINIGNNANAVGNAVFRGGSSVNVELSGVSINSQPSLIVRITQFLLRMMVILAVTFIIFNGIKYMLSVGEEDGASAAKQNLINIGIGLIIALLSVSIIYLVQSITVTTLTDDPKPFNDTQDQNTEGSSASAPFDTSTNGGRSGEGATSGRSG